MSGIKLENGAEKKLQELARHQMKTKLLNDILIDLTICEIEGWSKTEYLDDLKNLINNIGQKTK